MSGGCLPNVLRINKPPEMCLENSCFFAPHALCLFSPLFMNNISGIALIYKTGLHSASISFTFETKNRCV